MRLRMSCFEFEMKSVFVSLAILLTAPAQAGDITEESRKLIEREVAQYKEKGPSGFLAVATKNGPVMSDKSAKEIIDGFVQIEAACGKPVDHSIKKIAQLSDSVTSALFIINLEKCPVFFRQTIYRTKAGHVVAANFNLHTQPEAIWPNSVLFPN